MVDCKAKLYKIKQRVLQLNQSDKAVIDILKIINKLEYISSQPPASVPLSCNLFKGMTYNQANSCYTDSVLVPLLFNPAPYIKKYLLNNKIKLPKNDTCNTRQIINELIKIHNKISKGETGQYCTNFRKVIKNCNYLNEFSGTHQDESGAFITKLLHLFVPQNINLYIKSEGWNKNGNLYYKNKSSRKTYVVDTQITPKMYNTIQNNNKQITYYEETLFDNNNLWKADDNEPTKLYNKKRSTYIIKKIPFLVLNVNRIETNYTTYAKKNITPLNIKPEFSVADNKLYLFAIIVHGGDVRLENYEVKSSGHYTSYMLCSNKWYYYNDGGPSFTPIGTFDQMLKSTPNPRTMSTVLMYG
jgi:ubiquitin C-terminal hydrolase